MREVDPRRGERLREIRQHREMSQARLARAVGVTVGTIKHYEHARIAITADRRERLAVALQCEPLDLLMPPGSHPPRYRRWRPRVGVLPWPHRPTAPHADDELS